MPTKYVLIAKSMARDAARGRALTKDAYIADFERFKAARLRTRQGHRCGGRTA